MLNKVAFFHFLFLWYSLGYAQKAVVANDELKVLYRNYENKITIAKTGYDCSQLRLLTSAQFHYDTIQITGKGCYYNIKTNLFGWVNLVVEARKDDDTTPAYDTLTFFVKTIEPPTPTLGGKIRGGKGSKSVIKAIPGIIAVSSCDLPFRCSVLSFEFHCKSKDHRQSVNLRAKGPLFTSEMQKVIDKTTKGDSIIIDHIIVTYANIPSEDIGTIEFIILSE
jgi:hypothetical protein